MEYYTSLTSSHLMQAEVELKAQRVEESAPEMAYFGDGHRCKRFPCPICNQGRSLQIMLQSIPDHADAGHLPHHHDQADQAPVLNHVFGDGGHTCKRFPCPICQQGR